MVLLAQKKMIVYIDALNLYYGLLRHTKFRWIDIELLIKSCFTNDIVEIKFFYARVKSTILDPDAPIRQMRYIDALQHHVGGKVKLEMIEGYFLDNVKKNGIDINTHKRTTIITNEEKGTDVNIGVHIVTDSFIRSDYDIVCLVSNDSDLSEALRIAKSNNKTIFLLSPIKKLPSSIIGLKKSLGKRIARPAGSLSKYALIVCPWVSESKLYSSQMPENIVIPGGTISMPQSRK